MQDFGKIKTVYNDILVEAIVKKDEESKKLFQKYLKTIKESEILRTQFLVYNNIETKVEKDFNSASLFVSENMKLFRKYKIEDIVKENKRLVGLLDVKRFDNAPSNKLYESLAYLITTPRTAKNVGTVSNELRNVIEFINKNETPVVTESFGLPNSFVASIMVQKYNEKYSDMLQEDKDILKVLISSDLNEKMDFYNKTVSECLVTIDGLLNESNEETKDKLIKVKERLLEKNEITENQFLDKVIKLVELKNNLT